MKKNRNFKGLGISPGIAIGQVHLLESETLIFPRFWVSDREIRHEIARFRQALSRTQRDLARVKEKLCKFQIGEQVRILESHQMIAGDETLVNETIQRIRQEKINAEWAFDKIVQKMRAAFETVDKNYFQERYEELNHVVAQILRNLMGSSGMPNRQFKKDSVIVARDLSPADTAQMVKGMVQGFLLETGGPTSHTAIIARALEIPTIVGINGITHLVSEGESILMDGNEGLVIVKPTKRDSTKYRAIQKRYDHFDLLLRREAHLPSVTQDGFHIRLAANMELLEELSSIKNHGAEGIGLYRTEMLAITKNRIGTEEEQFQAYKEILHRIAPHSATIRTLDMGGDKVLDSDYMDSLNPALGLRAIRYGLKQKDILRTQLRAMLRASRHGRLKILIPMVTNLEEMRIVKKIILDIQEELAENKIPFAPDIKLGAMIEIPSAALMADEFASELDFMSIGTNDLIQYTLAVDRTNDDVSYLYEPLHPAILRLLKMVCDAGRSRNIEVSLCGEMAGHPLCFPILLGLGLSELSMNSVSIPRVKKLTRSMTFRQAKELLDRSLNCKTAGEVEHLVKREAAKIPGFPTY